ncbi:MAG: MBL fold metallo-hydrolase [Candidatus Latescibacteria bacterium]|jgi:metallo-beta-lactamase family protein|nr:MBL fold metallo-hydrolase [Candidatus Latescibacterota bacterium]
MQITFCGGAQTVTGSQYVVSVNGQSILIECGLFQGRRDETYQRNRRHCYDPARIDAVVLSHAHIDHSGNIPNLVRNGYDGPIYSTAATADLCQIMLRDSAFLQSRDVEFVNKRRKRRGDGPIEPLYTIVDAEEAMSRFVGVQYDRRLNILPGVHVTFQEAGHILGSSSPLLEIEEGGRTVRFGYTGDLGRYHVPILRDPDPFQDLDVLVMESTYGNRIHGPDENIEEELAHTVREVAGAGGKIIIPAFAVGRTQVIVYMLHKLCNEGRIPEIPMFVDSPLATSATQVFRTHPECFDRDTYQNFLEHHEDPFGFGRLKYVGSVEESKKLNGLPYPHIIISASGMAEGGRVLHHLRNNIGDRKNMVLFVGYAARHTLARRIMDGERTVRIFGERHTVRCKVKTMDVFSAHADRDELLAYVDFCPPKRLQHLFLVHGEPGEALPLKADLEEKGYRQVHYPADSETAAF